MRSDWVRVGPDPVAGVLIRRKNREKWDAEEGPVKMGAESKPMQL